MTRISGWVFMAIGAVVSLFSRYVQKRGGEGMGLFFWVGIIMIGIGIFKVVSSYILKEKNPQEQTQKKKKGILQFFGFNRDLEEVNESEIMNQKQQALNKINQTSILVCPACGTKHYSNSNFCHMCGTKLR